MDNLHGLTLAETSYLCLADQGIEISEAAVSVADALADYSDDPSIDNFTVLMAEIGVWRTSADYPCKPDWHLGG